MTGSEATGARDAGLVMPKLGLTMTEGLLSEWRVAPGDRFEAGDVLFTVETDKVANEIEADGAGVLGEVLVAAGETVPVGTPVARLAGGTSAAPSRAGTGIPAPANETSTAPAPKAAAGHRAPARADGARIVATPLARRLAAASGVDLSAVTGSGPRGRIKAADVEAVTPSAPPTGNAARTETTASIAGPAAPDVIMPDAARLATARRVSAARRDIPDFAVFHTADVGALLALRDSLNADEGRPRVSVTHMLIRALGLALAERPDMNRIWVDDRILAYATADVGMVVETPEGLRVPILRDTGRASLDDVAASARDLASRARAGSLTPQDVGGGVVSISNVGMFGVRAMTPIINPPHAMILGVGADRPDFRPDAEGRPVAIRALDLTLVSDHRIVDGADAARFLAAVVAILETPVSLLRPPRRAA